MPFTFAHPAAVLPFGSKKSSYLDFSALVLGSMAPDYEYFIHFKPYQVYGHTLMGQVFYNLPMVIIAYIIYNLIVKESIIFNLPRSFRNHYIHFLNGSLRIKTLQGFIVFIYSSLLGMFTHIFWDSFTHKEGYFVRNISIFSKNIDIIGFDIPIYKILQHGSTLIGLSAIVLYLLLIPSRKVENNIKVNPKPLFWISIIVIQLVITLSVIIALHDFSIGRIIVSLISSGLIAVVFISAIDKFLRCKL